MTLSTGPQVAHQTGIPYRMLHHWTSHGAITPTVPANGPGSRTHWTPRDIRILSAIGHVNTDLHTLGLAMTTSLVARLWHDLNHHSAVTITQGTVTITVDLCDTAPAHLGSASPTPTSAAAADAPPTSQPVHKADDNEAHDWCGRPLAAHKTTARG